MTGRTAFLSPGSRLTAIYFAVQALLGLAWWIGLGISDAFREVFTPSGYPETHIATFLIADAVLFVGGSALTAVLAYRRSPRVVAFQFVTLGAVLYATLHCLGLVVEAGDQWPAAVLMGWSSVGTLVFATLSRPSHGALPSFPMRTYRFGSRRAVLATVLQIIAVWGVFLLLIPWHVRSIERAIGLPRFPALPIVGWGLFALASLLGLWCGSIMALVGRGTPLPTASATRIVIAGPYRVVRNPMALAGLTQGLGIAIALGSWTLVVYAVLGGLVWQICIRPVEESDLLQRFPDEYPGYQSRVRCWFPRVRVRTSDGSGPRRSE